MAPKRQNPSNSNSESTSKKQKTDAASGSGSTKYNPSATVTSRLHAVFDVRDEWRTKVGKEQVAYGSYGEFLTYVLSSKDQLQQHPKVERYLQVYLDGTSRLDLYSAEELKTQINQGTERRMYRVVAAVDDPHNQGDNRLRDMLLWFESNCNKEFSKYALICPSFTYVLQAQHTKSKSDMGVWYTGASNPIEKFLMMAFINEIQTVQKKYGKKKKADSSTRKISSFFEKKNSSKADDSPENTLFPPTVLEQWNYEKHHNQRVGFFVQYITRAWDILARKMEYKSMEELILPYVKYDVHHLRFDVIPKREGGYMPLESNTSFDPNVATTTIPEETFEGVTEIPDNVDRIIRGLVKEYLDDMRRHVFLASMYNDRVGEPQLKRRTKQFSAKVNPMPERFNRIDDDDIERVRLARRQILGLSPDSTPQQSQQEEPDNSQHRHRSEIDNDNKSSIVEDLQDRIRDSNVPLQVYRKKLNMMETVSSKKYSTELDIARKHLQEHLFKYCFLVEAPFSDLEELATNESWYNLKDSAQLILTDPPYNIRRERGMQNAEHDKLHLSDMEECVETIDNMLRPGGHAIIFCSVQQYADWEKLFANYHNRQSSRSSAGNLGTGKTFNVDPTPIVCLDKVNAHRSFPGRTSCTLQNAYDFSVHVKKNGLSYEEEEKMVNYKPFGFVESQYSAVKNAIDNVPGLAPGEGVPHKEPPETGSRLLRPEQKPLPLLKELISRYSQPGDIVVDLFAGTFSTAIACFSLPQHRTFAGCEKDKRVMDTVKQHVQDRFAQFISDPNSVTDMDVPDDVLENACRLVLSSSLQMSKYVHWKAPGGFPQYQIFPLHITTVFTSMLKFTDFYRQYSGSDLSTWPLPIQQRFNAMNPKDLLLAEQSRWECHINESNIKHPNAGLGVFAGQSFAPGDIVCYYFGTLVYDDLYSRKSKKMLYGGSQIMNTTVDRFKHFAIQISTSGSAFQELRPSGHGKRAVYVVPPDWCLGAYINDYNYDKDDAEYAKYIDPKVTLPNLRKANVSLTQQKTPVTSISGLHEYHCVAVTVLCAINKGEELYTDYSRSNFGMRA